MRVLITGGAGFLGSRLARTLLEQGTLGGKPFDWLVLADLQAPADPTLRGDARVAVVEGDVVDNIPALFAEPVDAVFHLASAVSAECEADFDLGLHANLDTTRRLLDACREQQTTSGHAPLFLFSSSVAVFGSDPALPLPDVVDDRTLPTPQSSYGIHKFVCEQLVADYTRKGYVDGRSVRLMTVAVRPGRPNGAASSFLSGIIREPLAGLPAVCPVPPELPVSLASPATTIAGILATVEAPRDAGTSGRTAVNLPALTVTVGEMIETLRDLAGDAAAELVRFEPDPDIVSIVGGWPSRFQSDRARALGLPRDQDFADVVRQYIRDNGQPSGRRA